MVRRRCKASHKIRTHLDSLIHKNLSRSIAQMTCQRAERIWPLGRLITPVSRERSLPRPQIPERRPTTSFVVSLDPYIRAATSRRSIRPLAQSTVGSAHHKRSFGWVGLSFLP